MPTRMSGGSTLRTPRSASPLRHKWVAIRLNSGRWKTIKSFDDLMKVKGDEPSLERYSNNDEFQSVDASIRACLPVAEKAGVAMALENHCGLTTDIDMLLRIWREVNSPWLLINADIGIFLATLMRASRRF